MCFSLLSVVFYGLLKDMNINDVIKILKPYAFGIRNTLVSGGLWFIPCIFVVSVMYFILYKVLKNRYLVLLSSVIIFILNRTLLPTKPSWFMNIDSAMYFILYYAIGNICFDVIKNFSFKKSNFEIKVLFIVGVICSSILTGITYFYGAGISINIINKVFKFLEWVPLITQVHSALLTLSIIFSNIIVAYAIRNISVFKDIGRNTLALCGIESMTKLSIEILISILGLSLNLINPLACVFYTFICLLVAHYAVSKVLERHMIKPILTLVNGSNTNYKNSNITWLLKHTYFDGIDFVKM